MLPAAAVAVIHRHASAEDRIVPESFLHVRFSSAHATGPSSLVACAIRISLSVVGALILCAALVAAQAGQHARQVEYQRRVDKARRLRKRADNSEAEPPDIAKTEYHLFLSHVWDTGQDQMRIIKKVLLEMMPDLKVFLDVDGMPSSRALY